MTGKQRARGAYPLSLLLVAICIGTGVVLGITLNKPSPEQPLNASTPASEAANRQLQAAVSPKSYSAPGNAGALNALWNATITAEAAYSQDDTYSSVTPSLLNNLGAHLRFVASNEPSTRPGVVSILTAPQHIIMSSRSKGGNCIFVLAIKAQASSNTFNHFNLSAKGTYYDLSGRRGSGGESCQAADTPSRGWRSSI